MRDLLIEILRGKRVGVGLVLILLLCDAALLVADFNYLSPSLQKAHADWSRMRGRVSGGSRSDAATVYRQGRADLEKLSGRIPAQRDFAVVLGEILDAAAASGVVTGDVNYQPLAQKQERLAGYTVSLSSSGSYAALKSLLGELQRLERLVVIEELSMSNTNMYEEQVAMNVRLTVYLKGAP